MKMTDRNEGYAEQQALKPSAALRQLDRLVGTWQVSGGVEGQVVYEWMEGGFFLLQHVDFGHVKGVEVIGHLHPFGEEPGKDIKSRFYSFLDGMTLDYVYEIEGDTLTIWGGERGSPAYYQGVFSADGTTLSGRWVYPDGGGYESTSTRVS
jgi:hypothetical protein